MERIRPLPAAIAEQSILPGRVATRTQSAQDILGLEIESASGGALSFRTPGAHIDVHVHEGLVRQYSLTGAVRSNRYSIAVLLEPGSRGGSRAIHASFQPGKLITLWRPRNHFPLNEDAQCHVLFSGGIGMTPILAMAWRLHELDRQFSWHLSARSLKRLAWANQIGALPFRRSIQLYLDGPSQRLDAFRALRAAPPAAHIYIYGPRAYMDYVTSAAKSSGIAPGQIHREHFGARD